MTARRMGTVENKEKLQKKQWYFNCTSRFGLEVLIRFSDFDKQNSMSSFPQMPQEYLKKHKKQCTYAHDIFNRVESQ